MSKETKLDIQEHNIIVKANVNPNLHPIFADHIIQIAAEPNAVKLILGCRVNNQIINNAIVILPIDVVFSLQDALVNLFNNPDLQKIIIDTAENSTKALQNRFNQSK